MHNSITRIIAEVGVNSKGDVFIIENKEDSDLKLMKAY